METWRFIFRKGFAPLLSFSALEALKSGIQQDDPALLQGCVVFPKLIPGFWDVPAVATGLLAYIGKEGEGLFSVAEVTEFHNRLKEAAAQKLGAVNIAQGFIEWFDKTPRQLMRKELLKEVRREIKARKVTIKSQVTINPSSPLFTNN